jgi:SAM-dependent methyltransferase
MHPEHPPGQIATDRTGHPPIEDQTHYYDRRYSEFEFANQLQLERAVAILDALHATQLLRPRICDLGSGSGWLTAILGCFGAATGIELSPVAAQIAADRFRHVTFVAGNVLEWQPAGPPFDVVVSQEVVEHFVDQAAYLDVAARVLAPGGWLILTTPNATTFGQWPEAQRVAWTNQPVENHLTAQQLRELLDRRFDVVSIRSITLGPGHGVARRVAASPRIQAMVEMVGLRRAWVQAGLRLGLGMHLVAIARKR